MTERVIIAVLLPITVLAVAGVALLSQRYTASTTAAAAAHDVRALDQLADLREHLDYERMPVEGFLRARQFGIDAPDVSAALGFGNLTTAQSRTATDTLLRAMGPTVPAGLLDQLRALRAEVDAGRIQATPADRAYGRLDTIVSRAFAARLATLQHRIASLGATATLQRSLASLSDANEALSAGVAELGDLSDLELPGPGSHDARLSQLGEDAALLQDAGSRLRAEGGPAAADWNRFMADPSELAFQRQITGALAGRSASVSPDASFVYLLGVSANFRTGVAGGRNLYALVDDAENEVMASASALSAADANDFRQLLVETLLAVGATIAVALLLAKSITRPLGVLEGRARAVSSGDLEVGLLGVRGPKETVVVSEAFNDLVGNLRLLEAKTRALAACAFEDPVLAQPLPGRLGQALHESVAVLSGSMVERDALQQRLVHQATHDALTGLHNRVAAIEFLGQALARAGRCGEAVAVLFVDLDDFKRANDTHGHAVGDAILKLIGVRLAHAARRGDFLARLGGDEFLVIAEGVGDPGEATMIGQRLVAAAGEIVELEGVRTSVGACVGVAFALDGLADDPSQLLARADLAVYRAKHSGRGHVEIYDESLQEGLLARAAVERDLHAALDNNGEGLFLHYQPLVDASTGNLVALEALVRWQRPGHGRCAPDQFIPAAELSDLIIELDRWVMHTALTQLATINQHHPQTPLHMSVNISGRHLLSGTLFDHVTSALKTTNTNPEQLVLEVTETVLLSDLPTVATELQKLRAHKIKVAIDDFGTGYTSLAHLQHLTVDEIKIDRSFIAQLPDGRDSSLVRMVTDLGHHLGVRIVAEGIETPQQQTALQTIGVDTLQGFLIAKPMPPEEIAAILASGLSARFAA